MLALVALFALQTLAMDGGETEQKSFFGNFWESFDTWTWTLAGAAFFVICCIPCCVNLHGRRQRFEAELVYGKDWTPEMFNLMHDYAPEEPEFHVKKKKKKNRKKKKNPYDYVDRDLLQPQLMPLSGLMGEVVIQMADMQQGPSPGKMAKYAQAAQEVLLSEKHLPALGATSQMHVDLECKECGLPFEATAEVCNNCGEPRPAGWTAPDPEVHMSSDDISQTRASAVRLGDSGDAGGNFVLGDAAFPPSLETRRAAKSKKSLQLGSLRTESEIGEDLLIHGIPPPQPSDLDPNPTAQLGRSSNGLLANPAIGKFTRYESDKEMRYSSVGSAMDLQKKAMMNNEGPMERMSLGDIKSPGGASAADLHALLAITESRGASIDPETPRAKISIAAISADVVKNVYGGGDADDLHLSTTDDMQPKERRSSFLKTNKVLPDDIERRSVKKANGRMPGDASPILTLNIQPKKTASGDGLEIPLNLRLVSGPDDETKNFGKSVSLADVASQSGSSPYQGSSQAVTCKRRKTFNSLGL